VLSGTAWIRHPGIQNDEALFASVIYHPVWGEYSILGVPVMLISYLGAVKGWLYAPLFWIWPPSPASIRLPMLLAGALTVWLFYRLLRRIHGPRAALIGAALLATDTTFLLTTRCDWGPTALQHVFLVAGMLLLLRFSQTGSLWRAAAGFFLFGLGCWDKALFLWLLSGLLVATLVCFPRRTLALVTPRGVGLAAFSFLLGALPLAVFNLDPAQPLLSTLRRNTSLDVTDLGPKARSLFSSLEGSVLFGYLAPEDAGSAVREPSTRGERACIRLNDLSGRPRRGLLNLAFLGSIALLPLVWRKPAGRAALFALLALLVAWLQMALTKDTGNAHHTVLLSPLPHMVIALVWAELALRWNRAARTAIIAAAVLVAGSNLLLTNHYYAQLIRNGSTLTWTDAIYPLSDYLKTITAKDIFVLDWGMLDSLRLLNRGQLNLRVGTEAFADDVLTEQDLRLAQAMAKPDNLFLSHVEGSLFSPEPVKRMEAWAGREGYTKRVLRIVPDRNGRPVFEVFRLESQRISKAPNESPSSRASSAGV